MISLEGKKALVTGGSRGIGRATAILFARAGADVAINFLNREKAAFEVKKAVHDLGRDCLALKADISQKNQVKEMVVTLLRDWNHIDILVNNAGIWTYGEIGSMDSIPLKRIPPPEDVAGPILFLASDLAQHITGEVVNVNGGSVLCA